MAFAALEHKVRGFVDDRVQYPLTRPADLSARLFWERTPAERDAAFAALRREQPVSWQEPPDPGPLPGDRFWQTGYWAIVRYADVRAVSRDPRTFSSAEGVMFEGRLLDVSESIVAMDSPLHAKMRGVISEVFTPRNIARIEDQIQRRACELVAGLDDHEQFDFIERVAAPLPMLTLLDLIGVPKGDREQVRAIVKSVAAWADCAEPNRDPFQVLRERTDALTAYAIELARYRTRNPTGDVMTRMVQARIDGECLSDWEIGGFFVLLCLAGTDTTRRTASQAVRALSEHPEQRALLLADLPGRIDPAVEEFLRWASPVTALCRTATIDTELSGQPISAGDRVAMFYRSANFDEEKFEDPGRFEIMRAPNPHVGFGGGGPHRCLGAGLARAELRAIIRALLIRAPRFAVGESEVLADSPVSGDQGQRQVTRLPCRLSGR